MKTTDFGCVNRNNQKNLGYNGVSETHTSAKSYEILVHLRQKADFQIGFFFYQKSGLCEAYMVLYRLATK